MSDNPHTKVDSALLMLLSVAGVSPDEAIAFFVSQSHSMQACPPNYTPANNNRVKGLNYTGNFWVMRGFYPNTPVMFKIVMVKVAEIAGEDQKYWSKVSLITPKVQKGHLSHITVNDELHKQICSSLADKALVNDKESKTVVLTQRVPKCMSPKGCAVFNPKNKGKF